MISNASWELSAMSSDTTPSESMLLLRCDAGSDIGTGHFFRQLALGEYAATQGRDIALLIHEPLSGLLEQAESIGLEVQNVPAEPGTEADAKFLYDTAQRHDTRAIVADGYHFGPEYYDFLRRGDWTVGAVDDIAHQPFPVDVLINQNIDAGQLDYDTPDRTTKLLGVQYALMREQFRAARRDIEASGGPEVPPRVRKIIVFMGGGDPSNETTKVLEGLRRAKFDGVVDVVLGTSNPHQATIRRAGEALDAEVRYHENVSDMAGLIRGHDLSINAGGSTSWELACLGVPMMQIIVADNQRDIVEGLSSRNISINLGWQDDVTPETVRPAFRSVDSNPEQRRRQIRQGMELIDGRGVERVLRRLVQ